MRALRVTTTYHIASRRIQEKRATRYTRVLPFNDLLKHRKTIYLSLAPCVLCVLLLLLLLFLIITPHTHTHTHTRTLRKKIFQKGFKYIEEASTLFLCSKKKKIIKNFVLPTMHRKMRFSMIGFCFFFFCFSCSYVCVRSRAHK